jgi:DNA-binding CsgD family transcriptional regulator/tetratricopeptide (TPR) repeat protein
VEEVYARAEGHPFFTEQLLAATVTDLGQRGRSVTLPVRLAELLVARAARCGGNARTVLNALAVAGRSLTEVMLAEVTRLDRDRVTAAVRELTVARLLAVPADEGHRPRHALLGEAVAAELLPGEQVSLHERIAHALQMTGDETLAAEAAGHWAAAGRTAEELQARLAAANAAERVFAYADAATHWQRAIELCQVEPDASSGVGVDVPHLYIRAVDALEASGDQGRAAAVAEDAYRRFADHPDPTTAALAHLRAGYLRALDSPAAGRPLMNEALRLFEGTPPSAEHAKAWYWYATYFLMHYEGARPEEIIAALNRALEIAEEVGAATLIPQVLCVLTSQSFARGTVEEGLRLLARARSVSEVSRDPWAVLTRAVIETYALLVLGKLEEATQVGLHGVEAARQGGVGNSLMAGALVSNTAEGLYLRGRTAEAAALVDPHTMGPIDRDNVLLHACSANIDLLRGEVDAALDRLAQTKLDASLEISRDLGQRFAEVALWAGRPGEALEEVQRLLERLEDTVQVIFCGWLLAVGMRACADLAERARARRDDQAVQVALAAADDLASWVQREHDVPFTEHPFVATIPAERVTWDAEHARATRPSDPVAWSVAAERWEALDYRHRAGYARWRQAEALLATPRGGGAAATVLSTAAGLAAEHVPLTTAIRDLARRARIDLDTVAEPVQPDEPPTARAFGLTERELDVLRLLGQGKTNPEIAAALFISPRTAGVHVTHILRKLDATTRVQAATIGERAGLLAAEPTRPGAP